MCCGISQNAAPMSVFMRMQCSALLPVCPDEACTYDFGIQPYLIERTLEQIKMDLAYQKLGINVVGTGAAVDYPKYGYSHYCAEDAQLIK